MTNLAIIPSALLAGVAGGADTVANEIASHARRVAEDRVTPNCLERFGNAAGSQQQVLGCIQGAGDQAFDRTLNQLSGVPLSR